MPYAVFMSFGDDSKIKQQADDLLRWMENDSEMMRIIREQEEMEQFKLAQWPEKSAGRRAK